MEKNVFGIYYLVANVIGFILGLITNYCLSKYFIFKKENSLKPVIEFISYAAIGIVGLGIDTLIMWIFTEKIRIYYMISKIISTAIVFIWNFTGRKILYKVSNKILLKEEK